MTHTLTTSLLDASLRSKCYVVFLTWVLKLFHLSICSSTFYRDFAPNIISCFASNRIKINSLKTWQQVQIRTRNHLKRLLKLQWTNRSSNRIKSKLHTEGKSFSNNLFYLNSLTQFPIFSYSGGNNSEDISKTNEASYRVSRENDTIDSKYGFDRVKDNTERTGYLINMHSVSLLRNFQLAQSKILDSFIDRNSWFWTSFGFCFGSLLHHNECFSLQSVCNLSTLLPHLAATESTARSCNILAKKVWWTSSKNWNDWKRRSWHAKPFNWTEAKHD